MLSHDAHSESKLVPVCCLLVRDGVRRIGGEHSPERLGGIKGFLKEANAARELDMEWNGVLQAVNPSCREEKLERDDQTLDR